MRVVIGLLCCLSLPAADVSELRRFLDTDRIFELHRTLQRSDGNDDETLLIKTIVAARVGRESDAIANMRTFLAAHPDSLMNRKVYEELASALVRTGRYGEAADAWAAALRLTPNSDKDRSDNTNTQRLYDSLRNVPAQGVEFQKNSAIQAQHNRLGSWNVPVQVNGQASEWIFDTGANWSTLAESEAVRLKLRLRETGTYVSGSTGRKNPLRLAIADDLDLGLARVRNVVFLVLTDDALSVAPLQYQIKGILGLPVLRALGRITLNAQGQISVQEKSPISAEEPNLFFHELTPLVEVLHREHRLQMFLDTGANATFGYPSLKRALSKNEIDTFKRKREKMAGAGGMIKRRTEVVPTLHLELLSRLLNIPNVSFLSAQPSGDAGYRDGVLGMDGLAGGFILDFRIMQFHVE